MSIDESGFLSPEIEVYRQRIRQRYVEYFNLIEAVDRCCHSAKTRFEAHNRDGQEMFAVGLFLKLLADAEAATLLLERGMASQARSLLRVGIECSIILAKICQEYKFAQIYAIVAEQERLRLIKGIKDDKRAGYENLRAEFTDALVTEIEATVKGVPTKNLWEWAADVNMAPVYAGPYRLFCADVHSGAASLSNFFISNSEGEIEGINWGPEVKEYIGAELLEAAYLLLTGLALGCKLFKVNVDEEANPLWEEYKRLGAASAGNLP